MAVNLDSLPEVIHLRTNNRRFLDLCRDIEAIEKVGKWIARSKFFNCDYDEQGYMIACECYLTGQTPLEYAKKNKIVAGKPFVQYDSMLASFNQRGGTHKILKHDSEAASVEFTYQGQSETYTLTWEDLKKEPIPYLGKECDIIADMTAGKELKLKPKYATPRSRSTMLFARLVSSTLRVLCPEVNFGTYTEEEISDIVDAKSVVTVDTEKRRESISKMIESKVETEPKADPKTAVDIAEPVSRERIEKLENSHAVSINEPCMPTQQEKIVQLMGELFIAGQKDIKERVKAKLAASGLERIKDLTIAEADLLIKALSEKNSLAWFEASLSGYKLQTAAPS